MTDPKIVMLKKARYVVTVPTDAGDFYVSGTGHLCARTPTKHTVHDQSLQELGVEGRIPRVIGRAGVSDIRAANLALDQDESVIVVVTS